MEERMVDRGAVLVPRRSGAGTVRMVVVTVVLMSLLATASPAEAHYVYRQAPVWTDDEHCVVGRSEISHGAGGGYTKISVALHAPDCPTGTVFGLRASRLEAREARVRHVLWKQSSSGAWSACRRSAWQRNARWLTRHEHGIHYGSNAPCGNGNYSVTGEMQVLIDGVWRGGRLHGGSHRLP
jgi:hypothetical protein